MNEETIIKEVLDLAAPRLAPHNFEKLIEILTQINSSAIEAWEAHNLAEMKGITV